MLAHGATGWVCSGANGRRRDPHPGPLPEGEGARRDHYPIYTTTLCFPLPAGEGLRVRGHGCEPQVRTSICAPCDPHPGPLPEGEGASGDHCRIDMTLCFPLPAGEGLRVRGHDCESQVRISSCAPVRPSPRPSPRGRGSQCATTAGLT